MCDTIRQFIFVHDNLIYQSYLEKLAQYKNLKPTIVDNVFCCARDKSQCDLSANNEILDLYSDNQYSAYNRNLRFITGFLKILENVEKYIEDSQYIMLSRASTVLNIKSDIKLKTGIIYTSIQNKKTTIFKNNYRFVGDIEPLDALRTFHLKQYDEKIEKLILHISNYDQRMFGMLFSIDMCNEIRNILLEMLKYVNIDKFTCCEWVPDYILWRLIDLGIPVCNGLKVTHYFLDDKYHCRYKDLNNK